MKLNRRAGVILTVLAMCWIVGIAYAAVISNVLKITPTVRSAPFIVEWKSAPDTWTTDVLSFNAFIDIKKEYTLRVRNIDTESHSVKINIDVRLTGVTLTEAMLEVEWDAAIITWTVEGDVLTWTSVSAEYLVGASTEHTVGFEFLETAPLDTYTVNIWIDETP